MRYVDKFKALPPHESSIFTHENRLAKLTQLEMGIYQDLLLHGTRSIANLEYGTFQNEVPFRGIVNALKALINLELIEEVAEVQGSGRNTRGCGTITYSAVSFAESPAMDLKQSFNMSWPALGIYFHLRKLGQSRTIQALTAGGYGIPESAIAFAISELMSAGLVTEQIVEEVAS